MTPDDLLYFRRAFRRAAEKLPDTPLVPGGKSMLQYADALDDPDNPDGQLLVKMADALGEMTSAPNHGYHNVVQIYKWMAGGR